MSNRIIYDILLEKAKTQLDGEYYFKYEQQKAKSKQYDIEYLHLIPFIKTVKEVGVIYTYPHFEFYLGDAKQLQDCTQLKQLTGDDANSIFKKGKLESLAIHNFDIQDAAKIYDQKPYITLDELDTKIKKINTEMKRTSKQDICKQLKSEINVLIDELAKNKAQKEEKTKRLVNLKTSIKLDERKIELSREAIKADNDSLEHELKLADAKNEYSQKLRKQTQDNENAKAKLSKDEQILEDNKDAYDTLADDLEILDNKIFAQEKSLYSKQKTLKRLNSKLYPQEPILGYKYHDDRVFIGKALHTIEIDGKEITYTHQECYLGDSEDLNKCTQLVQITGTLTHSIYNKELDENIQQTMARQGITISNDPIGKGAPRFFNKYLPTNNLDLETEMYHNNKQTIEDEMLNSIIRQA